MAAIISTCHRSDILILYRPYFHRASFFNFSCGSPLTTGILELVAVLQSFSTMHLERDGHQLCMSGSEIDYHHRVRPIYKQWEMRVQPLFSWQCFHIHSNVLASWIGNCFLLIFPSTYWLLRTGTARLETEEPLSLIILWIPLRNIMAMHPVVAMCDGRVFNIAWT